MRDLKRTFKTNKNTSRWRLKEKNIFIANAMVISVHKANTCKFRALLENTAFNFDSMTFIAIAFQSCSHNLWKSQYTALILIAIKIWRALSLKINQQTCSTLVQKMALLSYVCNLQLLNLFTLPTLNGSFSEGFPQDQHNITMHRIFPNRSWTLYRIFCFIWIHF